ncbi:MAG: ATP-grasp domain-containing protein [Chloroflexi bacterium]|nr:ATP-grasp domain-containing protein [Chloroflexota bacterium]
MKVLIANRNEIAVRIIRTCQEMGLKTVAVYTEPDQASMHVWLADEAVCIGSAQAYLDANAVIRVAIQTGADAIHPGYGFLSESAAFAQKVEEAGLVFIGPRSETIALLGDKLSSRKAAEQARLPVLPGSDGPLPHEIPLEMIDNVTFPVLVKATAGGGGRGIRLATSREELPDVIAAARKEAQATFGDDTVYLETLVQDARHIEVQILGDGQGKVLCLGDRECSIQRRRQKLIEEAPAPGLSKRLRKDLCEAAVRLGRSLHYRSLGTVEFLVTQDENFFFIEVNPRIQVEHPVSEAVLGLDLVKQQLLLATGHPLALAQKDIVVKGAAIEARILAEDSAQNFMPSTGVISYVKEPGGPGIRVDSALYQGMEVSSNYDSLIAKVIASGEDRPSALARLQRALTEFAVSGIATDVEFILQIIQSDSFQKAKVTTTYLDSFVPTPASFADGMREALAIAAALYKHQRLNAPKTRAPLPAPNNKWQQATWREQMRGIG